MTPDTMTCYAPSCGRSAVLQPLDRQSRYGFAAAPCGASRMTTLATALASALSSGGTLA